MPITLPHTFQRGQEAAVEKLDGSTVRVLTPAVLTAKGELYVRVHQTTVEWLKEAQERSVNKTLTSEETERLRQEDANALRVAGLQDTPEESGIKELPFKLEKIQCANVVITDVMDPKKPRVLGTFSFCKEKSSKENPKTL